MRITFVLKNWRSLAGGTRVIAKYAENLKNRGHEVVCISPPPPQPSFRQQVRYLLTGKGWIESSRSQTSYFDNTGVSCCTLESQRPVTNNDVPDADIVIAGFWKTAKWVAELSPSKGSKAYFMQDYGIPGQELEKVAPTWSLPLHIITISQWLVDLIHKHQGPIPVSLVPNSVDSDIFQAPRRNRQEVPTFGTIYTTKLSKGADIAIKAVEIAKTEIPNLNLVMFGREKLKQESIPGTVYHRGVTDQEAREIYASCDAWMFSSRVEGFGLPILEAMACRTPVIATPAGAAPELVNGYTGILVKPDDPQDMAAAICKISRLSSTEWQAMSEAAYNKATQYSWNDATDLFEAALYEAVQNEY